MQHKLMKTMLLALFVWALVPNLSAQVAHVGDILCISGVYVSPAEYEASGLEAMGVIFYVDATGQHGWAVALEDAGSLAWGPSSTATPLPDYTTIRSAIYDLNGMFNTQEILAYGTNNNITFPAFEAVDVANGWYFPSIGQLNYLYGNLVEVNTALAVCEGIPFDMTTSWRYWSSTEYNDGYAWWISSSGEIVSFGTNTSTYASYDSIKTRLMNVRAVRNF